MDLEYQERGRIGLQNAKSNYLPMLVTRRKAGGAVLLAEAGSRPNPLPAEDPHVILYSFLPVLLFGDALSIAPQP